MPFESVYLLVVGTLCSGVLVGISFVLRAKYNLRFLEIYSYFALVVAGYGLVNWVGPSMLAKVVEPGDAGTLQAIYLFLAVAVPIALMKLWLFFLLLQAMLEKRPTRKQDRAFGAFAAISVLLMFSSIYADVKSPGEVYSIAFATLYGVLVLAFTFLVVANFLALTEEVSDPELRRTARAFGWTYLIGYFFYASPYYLTYLVDLPWYPAVAPYAYYVLHIAPIPFVWQFAVRLDRQGRSRITRAPNIDFVVSRYQITSREKAIMVLLNDGLSNFEIAEKLSRSPNTVRNHVYNIYKKLDIKNRAQLRRICDG